MMGQAYNSEKGNILVIILITILLLAALTALFTRSSVTDEETGNSQAGSIAASKILAHASEIDAAINQLLMSGCSENTISFWTDYDGNGVEDASDKNFNPSSPVDKSCHIFHANGGAVPPGNATKTFSYAYMEGMGTAAADIYYLQSFEEGEIKRGLSRDICAALNRTLGNGFDINDLPVANLSVNSYTNNFDSPMTIGDNGQEVAMAGVKAGCVTDSGCSATQCEVFYSVVLKR